MTSKLDAVYRSILLTKFFTKGWGKPENLRRLFEFRKVVSSRDECFKLVERDYPVTITKEQNLADCKVIEGYFVSPLERYLPGIVPEIAQKAHFQAILPFNWPDPTCKPVCLHLAGTGDHVRPLQIVNNLDIWTSNTSVLPVTMGAAKHLKRQFFWRRRNLMVKPLLKEAGIGGIILENPFYGLRKPTDQIRSSLHNVSDIFVMGGCLILESLVMFHWCERNGLGPLGVTGLSMGGHMASLAATNWPKPLVLVPCLSWSTASAVFLEGVMSHSINWDLLEDQYLSDGQYREKLSKMVTIVDEAFLAGKKFARTYSQNMDHSHNTQKPETKHKNDKNLDITYKELKGANTAQDIVDINKNILDFNRKVPKMTVKAESVAQKENLKEEVKQLLDEGKITEVLYRKLTSNEKFVLEPQDIDNINKLSEEKIKEVLLRYKVEEIKNSINEERQTDPTSNDPKLLVNTSLTSETSPTGDKLSDDTEIIAQNKTAIDNIENKNKTKTAIDKSDTTIDDTNKKTAIVSVEKCDTKIFKSNSWNISELTSDLWTNLPFVRSSGRKIDISKIHWRDREALQFMRGIMDECTHLSNFSVPFDTSLIIAVCAKHDAYVPREDVGTLEEIWPGAEVRYVDAGHVSAYILHQSLFRSCIKEAFERSKKRWKDGGHID